MFINCLLQLVLAAFHLAAHTEQTTGWGVGVGEAYRVTGVPMIQLGGFVGKVSLVVHKQSS